MFQGNPDRMVNWEYVRWNFTAQTTSHLHLFSIITELLFLQIRNGVIITSTFM